MPEYYKRYIAEIIKNSGDMEYLIAVYTFAKNYPDHSKENLVAEVVQ